MTSDLIPIPLPITQYYMTGFLERKEDILLPVLRSATAIDHGTRKYNQLTTQEQWNAWNSLETISDCNQIYQRFQEDGDDSFKDAFKAMVIKGEQLEYKLIVGNYLLENPHVKRMHLLNQIGKEIFFQNN
jgi:hypothetical protein